MATLRSLVTPCIVRQITATVLLVYQLNSNVSGPKGSASSDEGLTLETSATNQTPQAKKIPYQPLLIKPIFSLLANAEKTQFFQTSLPVFFFVVLTAYNYTFMQRITK